MNYYQEKIETDSIIPARIYIRKSKGDNCHSLCPKGQATSFKIIFC